MPDAPYTALPQWPNAYPASGASATLKRLNEDFIVTELPLQRPSGEGEHLWLDVEKNGANTAFVAQQLAEAAGVQERDVGYAGLKDRYAITRQWFSIYLPKGETPDLTQLQHPEFKVLHQSRHVKKLRPGDLQGNRFRIVLRDVAGDRDAIEANLHGRGVTGRAQLLRRSAFRPRRRQRRAGQGDAGARNPRAQPEEEGHLPVGGALLRLQ